MSSKKDYCCWEFGGERNHQYSLWCECCTGWCKTCSYPIGYKLIESR